MLWKHFEGFPSQKAKTAEICFAGRKRCSWFWLHLWGSWPVSCGEDGWGAETAGIVVPNLGGDREGLKGLLFFEPFHVRRTVVGVYLLPMAWSSAMKQLATTLAGWTPPSCHWDWLAFSLWLDSWRWGMERETERSYLVICSYLAVQFLFHILYYIIVFIIIVFCFLNRSRSDWISKKGQSVDRSWHISPVVFKWATCGRLRILASGVGEKHFGNQI